MERLNVLFNALPAFIYWIDKKTNYQKSYKYLTSMKLFSLTSNKIKKLNDEFKAKEKEYDEKSLFNEFYNVCKELSIKNIIKKDYINEKQNRVFNFCLEPTSFYVFGHTVCLSLSRQRR